MADDEDPKKKIVPLDPDQRLIERLQELMNLPEGSPSVIVTFTPGVARWIDDNLNTKNRRKRPSAIKRYAAEMAAGKWVLNGSTVVFTDKHWLGDGQNRLVACWRSGRPFTTHCVFGVPAEFFYSIDQGRPRTPPDHLYLEGVHENTVDIHAAVRWAELIRTAEKSLKRTTFTSPEVLELWAGPLRAVKDFLPEARAITRTQGQPKGMVMALLYHFDLIDSDLAADFAEAWAAGGNQPRFLPIRQMQMAIDEIKQLSSGRRVGVDRTIAKGGRVNEVVRCAMIINAWNLVRAGKTRGAIRWDPTMAFPKIQ
jgi:hypothetical protein